MNEACVGGAIFNEIGPPPIATNCILWNDIGLQDCDEIYGCRPDDVTYCDVDGGWRGVGNIDSIPEFRDPALDDFHLVWPQCGDDNSSPCMDVGSPAIRDLINDCLHGLGDTISDMGAYGGHNARWIEETAITEPPLPKDMAIVRNYPNPFNAQTTIEYDLQYSGLTRIFIYNLLGQKIATLFDGNQDSGEHSLIWDALAFPSGAYFARLETGGKSITIKMALLK